MCQRGSKPLKPFSSQKEKVPALWRTELRTETSAELSSLICKKKIKKSCSRLQDTFLLLSLLNLFLKNVFLTWQLKKLLCSCYTEEVLNPDDQSVHPPLLPFPCSGSYLLWSRCSPRWHRCLASSGTEPSPRLSAELVEMTHNARIYINGLMRGEQRSNQWTDEAK